MEPKLTKLWRMQYDYNASLKRDNKIFGRENWTEKYLLGLVAETNEILEDINWKRHRRKIPTIDTCNLAYELADLTKYVLSLWQVWGFTEEEMLDYCIQKSEILEELYQQEFRTIPTGNILITDIDGTLGDWRKTFINWAEKLGVTPLTEDKLNSLSLDTDLSFRYAEYNRLKENFERTGGYLFVEPYEDSARVIRKLRESGVYVIAYTSRPVGHFHRIWHDTWSWLHKFCPVDELRIGHEQRLLLADELSENGRVAMFEDDPGIILRASLSGIKTFVRKQPYNEYSENNEFVLRVDTFDQEEIYKYFE
jgi:NTP pyrophosphatase (non-canonical NTP hydrolase)